MRFSLPFLLLGYAAASPRCLSTRQTGELSPIDIHYNSDAGQYYLELGIENTSIPAVVDTGSTTWWVSSKYVGPGAKTLGYSTAFIYGSASFAGEVHTLDVGVGGYTADDFLVAVIDSDHLPGPALVGLGLAGGETTVTRASYSNGTLATGYTETFVSELKAAGEITTAAYSLWLNDQGSGRGQLVFGGIDIHKFEGTLGRLPLVTTPALDQTTAENYHPAQPWQYAVNLNTLSLENSEKRGGAILSGAHLPVLLDSGSSFSVVQPKVLEALVASLNSTSSPFAFDPEFQMFVTEEVPSGNLLFDFSGVTITAPLADFFSEVLDDKNNVIAHALGIVANTKSSDINSAWSQTILGQNFLSSAYVVFDEEHYELAIAQARRGDLFGTTSIVAIDGDIPNASEAPRYTETQISGEYQVQSVQFN